jgi:hypothetical protein
MEIMQIGRQTYLIHKSHKYKKFKTGINNEVWRCTEKNCFAIVETNKERSKILEEEEINHSCSGTAACKVVHCTKDYEPGYCDAESNTPVRRHHQNADGEYEYGINSLRESELLQQRDDLIASMQDKQRQLDSMDHENIILKTSMFLLHEKFFIAERLMKIDSSPKRQFKVPIEPKINVSRSQQTKDKFVCNNCIKMSETLRQLNYTMLECRSNLQELKMDYENMQKKLKDKDNLISILKATIEDNINLSKMSEKDSNVYCTTDEGRNLKQSHLYEQKCCMKQKNSQTTCVNPENKNFEHTKMLLLSDSHGRDLGQRISHLVDKSTLTTTIAKPGARLLDVISDINSLTRGFTNRDAVIILAGTNDVIENSPYQLSIYKALDILDTVSRKTNVFIIEILNRYDINNNDDVFIANYILGQAIHRMKGKDKQMHLLRVNHILKRRNYTNHGLHLRSSGKWQLANLIASIRTTIDKVQSYAGGEASRYSESEVINDSVSCESSSSLSSYITVDATYSISRNESYSSEKIHEEVSVDNSIRSNVYSSQLKNHQNVGTVLYNEIYTPDNSSINISGISSVDSEQYFLEVS